jgi:uncharacterized protein (UPF0276 family)
MPATSPLPPRTPAQAAVPTGLAPGLSARAGVGLKPQHVREILATLPEIGFFEVHAENYMVDGGAMHHQLGAIRACYPITLHGVGLSIGGDEPLDRAHLDRLAALAARYQPAVVSEHLAWSSHGGVFFNDLLPLPWTRATLLRVCDHIDQVQSRLQRRLLLENPATYVEFDTSSYSEAQFLCEVLQRTGCGLLLDLSNVHVSCVNHGRDPRQYLAALPADRVGQVHLAGFATDTDGAGAPLLIDHHGAPVDDVVWQLYADWLALAGPRPTVIERDNNIPSWPTLWAEARHADTLMLSLQPLQPGRRCKPAPGGAA